MSVYLTTAYWKIKAIKKRIKVIQGGQGAGKNVAIAILLLEDMIQGSRDLTTIMTDTYDNLKDGAIRDFEYLFKCIGLDFYNYYNKSSKELYFNGATIQFRYISDSKGTSGKSKRRDKLYINEANKVGWATASTFIARTHGIIYIDFNPDSEFWAHTEVPKLRDKKGEVISESIILTYKDNEKCPQSEINYIESRKENKEWYRVYGLGLTGFYSERQIYRYKLCDKIPNDAMRLPSGMDFGTSPDPTILIDVFQKDNKLYVKERFCENNLMFEKIRGAERMSIVDKMEEIKFQKGFKIIGDSANRNAIDDLKKHGYNIKGVKKTGRIIDGINIIRSYDIYVEKNSVNVIKGFDNWFFKVDKNGKIIPEPDGHEPDGLAALRYVMMMSKRNRVFVNIDY